MNLSEYITSLQKDIPPPSLSLCLTSLWYDAKGDWDKAHKLIDSIEEKNAYWVHAYLHRKEGDIWNADYWYNRAGKKRPQSSLQEEWEAVTSALL